ncbi:agmatinase [Synergistes jonesii]|uniref:Agmatinase n=1 Tax=Synergistes jonesii TaxID=2754 RepID=A0A073INS3_9BACT|nr:agmatinase [Synergistes jonesii]KEJ91235.1 agmatinase [Synergistes jonesii]OFB60325.1 agmatinase [Synergistes jonesii]OFB65649.1 agmatinase [Synergistes jonesii]OFB66190.1 agmatinase [Synergistes jonesii]OFB66525.1 agmatinase [Synergistes jonesii]
MKTNIRGFIGCDAGYEEAQAVLFGAPFDSTTSFRPGARFGPAAMRAESFGMETYSPYQMRELEELSLFDAGDLDLPFGNAAAALGEIEGAAAEILRDGKLPCLIGGEHLVTLGSVRAAAKKFPELRLIHFDAHADLRDEYMGERLSHASVMRRCHDLLGDGRIFQFGIRSGCKEEMAWAHGRVKMEKFRADTAAEAAREIGEAPVYITVDLDVIDPSEFPGTGTPEAGGLCFSELLDALLSLRGFDVKAFDVCELSPHYDRSGVSTALACKTLREMLLAYL